MAAIEDLKKEIRTRTQELKRRKLELAQLNSRIAQVTSDIKTMGRDNETDSDTLKDLVREMEAKDKS